MLAKIYVEITNRCNLACAFCPGTKRPPRDMTAEEFLLLAPELRRNTNYVYFHVMGEPLLHPQLAEFLDIARNNDLRVILTTNGTLLSARAEALTGHPALHKVNISLHSLEANGALSLCEYIRACARFCVSSAKFGTIGSLRLWNLDGSQPGLNAANDEILRLLHECFPAEWSQNTRGFRLAPKIFLEFAQRFDWPDTDAPEHGVRGFCYALRDQAGILSDGTVVPCCLDHEGTLKLGNAFSEPLSRIFAAPPARAIYDGFSERFRAAALCRRCGYAERFTK